ncbi:MAG: glycerophosphodiester phosphodiesterase [Curvibacter sp. RIFCSPHIGHO2_12_FULL_63_18]|uniref:esterase-like activity of phytase family protein n=1 Tax=Rhodoferax sp. TaxID=50421 RepID=UPI0008B82C3A|nr:esterase-like activity of phytase family protein [Rhodoferax sp.]OGO95779.1 MAG: glycerophosphodiester phosphodiesterase [Curvibacter sp. GWA2_63_95]OGP05741.1 MAG: glycerophosphodiester phosphodiesterase [Curvibacter sp. RIFCSPHIGHO2_12_FULL_63_18]HCX81561.1 glycerophosphodiester phosphodiesterase [Rhodoferax sp.]
MRTFTLTHLALATALSLGASAALAQTEVTAVLAGHAALPSNTSVAAPKSAGKFFATAGKFAAANRQRTEALHSIDGITFVGDPKYPRKSGGSLPIKGQAVQGFSGIVSLGKGEFLALTDNGFGSKINSQDALLMVHHVKADWTSGKVTRQKTTFLQDPDRKVPFAIQNEATAERFLTGIDFDPESIQVVGNEWWIGDEFGPYVLRVNHQGKVLGVVETVVDGKATRGPDNYLNGRLPNYPGDAGFEVRRSGGFEPMAKAVDGKTVYPMFEWPLWDATAKAQDTRNGKPFTRILELDVATRTYGTRQWKYAFEEAGNVAADFQMLDATTGLVIERDDATEGAGNVCKDAPRTDCFTRPAKFKRIYKIDLSQLDADGFVKKVAFIDLTKIANPHGKAKRGPNEANFVLPHLGPEGLSVVDATHIVVVNDNNFPYSSGRTLGQPDDNELTLLDIQALVDAK